MFVMSENNEQGVLFCLTWIVDLRSAPCNRLYTISRDEKHVVRPKSYLLALFHPTVKRFMLTYT